MPERFLESEFGTKPGADNTARRNDFAFGAGRVSTHSGMGYVDRRKLTTRLASACAREFNWAPTLLP